MVQQFKHLQNPPMHILGDQSACVLSKLWWPTGVKEASSFTFGLQITGGIISSTRCSGYQPPKGKTIGPLGWPCHRGGAVSVSQLSANHMEINCMLFYTTPNYLKTDSIFFRRAPRYHDVVRQCEREEMHKRPINLSALVACIMKVYPNGLTSIENPDKRLYGRSLLADLRGVGAYVVESSHMYGMPEIGYALPTGGLLFHCLPVDLANSGLPPMRICIIAMFSCEEYPGAGRKYTPVREIGPIRQG